MPRHRNTKDTKDTKEKPVFFLVFIVSFVLSPRVNED